MTSIALSRDERQIVSGSADETTRLWDAETAAPIGNPITGHRDDVTCRRVQRRWSANHLRKPSDKTIRIWNSRTPANTLGKPIVHDRLLSTAGLWSVCSDVAISPDGAGITGADGTRWKSAADTAINVWDAQTLKPVVPPLIGNTDAFALSRDGSTHRITECDDAHHLGREHRRPTNQGMEIGHKI